MRKFMNERAGRAFILALCLAFVLGCSGLGQIAGQGILPEWQAEPLPQWEEAFRQADPRWRGADGSSSVPLSASMTLWLFGDTWIAAPQAEGRRGADIVRNSLALQEIGPDGPGRIRFFWREAADGKPSDAIPAEPGPGWLWPLSGARAGGNLFLFLIRCVESGSPLGLDLAGSLMLKVPNPDDPPQLWRIERFPVPFFRHTGSGDQFFGVACLLSEEFLYVYGVREDWSRGAEGRSLLVARTALESLERADFSAWQFFSDDGWAGDPGKAAPLFDGAATEMSVSHLPALGGFVAVYSYCGLSERILARVAPRPEGPWGEADLVYRCPDVSWSPNYFSYAGKAHPELARRGNELILTYATNSASEEDHYRDFRLYWPRFVRVAVR